jgi:hypothetical protein
MNRTWMAMLVACALCLPARARDESEGTTTKKQGPAPASKGKASAAQKPSPASANRRGLADAATRDRLVGQALQQLSRGRASHVATGRARHASSGRSKEPGDIQLCCCLRMLLAPPRGGPPFVIGWQPIFELPAPDGRVCNEYRRWNVATCVYPHTRGGQFYDRYCAARREAVCSQPGVSCEVMPPP